MKVYKLGNNSATFANPESVYFGPDIPEYKNIEEVDYLDPDAIPFALAKDTTRLFVGEPCDTHGELRAYAQRNGDDIGDVQGRLWYNRHLFTTWGEEPSSVIKTIKDKCNIDIGKYIYPMFLYFGEIGHEEYYLAVFTVDEYISLNINPDSFYTKENLDGLLKKQEAAKMDKNTSYAPNGMTAKDYWRHYKYVGESTRKTDKTVIINEKQANTIKEALDKKWGMPLKNALLSWADDYINEYWYEYPEFIKYECEKEWDFTPEEAEETLKEYDGFSREQMLVQINWNQQERQNFALWLYKRHSRFDNDDSDDEENDYEMRPIEGIGDTFEYKRDINNEWTIHFGNVSDMANIASSGFHHSAYNIDDLRATTDWRTKFGEEGYNFGYLALDGHTYYKSFWSYGSNFFTDCSAVLFKANGVLVYHKGDNEYQVIFPSNTAKDIIPLYDNKGVWSVKSVKTGKVLHMEPIPEEIQDKYDIAYWMPNGQKSMQRRGVNTAFKNTERSEWGAQNLENLVKWVTNNFVQYRSHLVVNDRLNEGYLYHRSGWGDGKEIDVENPKPYYSENRWRKWEGSGHETGSFGSGMYFTDEFPRDGNLNKREDDILRAKFNRQYDGQRFIKIADGLYRVDTDFYKNLYVLKSEKEGDILKALLSSVDSFVRACRRYESSEYNSMRWRQNRWLNIQRYANTLGLKVPWDYKGFCEFAEQYCKDESIEQTPATIFMEKNGFNGVDASMAGKYNSYWEGSVIYDLNKVEKDITPVLGPRDEFSIRHGFAPRSMANDILDNKPTPRYFNKEYEPDDPQKVMQALKRYNMVLEADRFWSLPDNIKQQYLIVLLRNIKKGFINIKSDNPWYYSTVGIKELKKDVYTENIIKYGLTDYMNIDDDYANHLLGEFSWGGYDKSVVENFLKAYQGDLNGLRNYQDVKEEYQI